VDATVTKVARSALRFSKDLAPLLAVLLAVTVVAALGGASIAMAHATNSALTEYRALRSSQSALLRTEQNLIDEETGIRGYAMTGDAAMLAPYTNAARLMSKDLATLHDSLLRANRPDLTERVSALAALHSLWNARVAVPTLRAADPRSTSALQIRGKQIVDRFRAVNRALQQTLTLQLRTVFRSMTNQIRITAYLSALLILLIAAVVVVLTYAASAARARLEKETRRKDIVERTAAQLRTVIRAIPHIVWIADRHGNITYVNERWHEFTGQAPAQALGQGWADAMHPDDVAPTLSQWQTSVHSGLEFEREYRLRGRDGVYVWFVARGLPERDADGTITRWLGTCTDIDAKHTQLETVQRVADAFAHAQLPAELPSTPLVDFDATYLPAEDLAKVGGDWYDVFALDSDRFFFSLGDVTGHGLEAALMMSRVRQAIVSFASVENDPAAILERTNRVLRMHSDSMVTALCGVLNARSGELQYASAGHPPALIFGGQGPIRELSSNAPPLGISDRIRIPSSHDRLDPGERLICYTDGIIENERDLIRGEARLREVLAQLTPFEYAEPARAVRERILGGRRGRDDVAILVISRMGLAQSVGTTAQSAATAIGKG